MAKCAFLLPGQGAQYIGMGRELAQRYTVAREVFREADDVLGYNISSIIFEGNEEELRQTEVTQPAVLTTSVAIFTALKEEGLLPEGVAGLSLGEYSALVCAGAIDFSEALPLVQKRARYMQEAVPAGKGGMAAVLRLDAAEVEELCREVSSIGLVEPANYNCPAQTVVSGCREALEELCRLAKKRKARAMMLSVSAPFHCALLKPVEEKMASLLEKVHIKAPSVPFVANVTAGYVNSPEEIKELLIKQVSRPVLWEDSMNLLLQSGYDLFIEVGPGRVLTGFMKKICRGVHSIHIEDEETLERLFKLLEEV